MSNANPAPTLVEALTAPGADLDAIRARAGELETEHSILRDMVAQLFIESLEGEIPLAHLRVRLAMILDTREVTV